MVIGGGNEVVDLVLFTNSVEQFTSEICASVGQNLVRTKITRGNANTNSYAVKDLKGMDSDQLVYRSTKFKRYRNPSGDNINGPIMSAATSSKGLWTTIGCKR
jgi:hypothetical protein